MSATRALADEYYEYRQTTEIVRLMVYGSTEHLERWDEMTPEAIAERQSALRRFADRADEMLTSDGLADDERTLLDVISFTARASASMLTWSAEQASTSPAFGFHSTLLTFIGRYSLSTADHGERYLAKLRSLPTALKQLTSTIEAAAAGGFVGTARNLAASADIIDRALAADTDQLRSQLPPTELDHDDAEAWTTERDRIVVEEVHPALRTYAGTLRALSARGRSDDEAGFCHLPGGAELYRELIWANTSLHLEPEDVHTTGLDMVARLEEEYLAIGGPLFGVGTVQEVYARLRDDPSMKYDSGTDIVRDAEAALAKAAEVAPAWFRRVPESACTANEIAQGALAFYSPPDLESGRQGQFFFNTSDPSAWSTYQLEAVTYHEAIPGHHFQLALHAESDDLHPVQRKFLISSYAEGWGLYTERLADEMGLYSGDLQRLGMLAADSMRACRLVVDTGLHALGWSRQQAIDYLATNSPLSEKLIEGEVDRYIARPGQAVSYMIGRIEVDRLRAEFLQRDDADLAEFHDRVLSHGMIPLPTLERVVLAA